MLFFFLTGSREAFDTSVHTQTNTHQHAQERQRTSTCLFCVLTDRACTTVSLLTPFHFFSSFSEPYQSIYFVPCTKYQKTLFLFPLFLFMSNSYVLFSICNCLQLGELCLCAIFTLVSRLSVLGNVFFFSLPLSPNV